MRSSTDDEEPDDQDGSAPGGMCRLDVECKVILVSTQTLHTRQTRAVSAC